jgi:hypothetical protein
MLAPVVVRIRDDKLWKLKLKVNPDKNYKKEKVSHDLFSFSWNFGHKIGKGK